MRIYLPRVDMEDTAKEVSPETNTNSSQHNAKNNTPEHKRNVSSVRDFPNVRPTTAS